MESPTYQPATLQPSTFQPVTLVAHADWSKNPSRRWMAVAVFQSDQQWHVSELTPAAQPPGYFADLTARLLQPGCILAGFDFPIGIPYAYANRAGITHFLAALKSFGQDSWREFYLPAEQPSQINLQRPFYPFRPGHSACSHLEQGLWIPFHKLYRLCEMSHDNRRPACPLFWTMGGQQVGKAAISGWQSLLAPALSTSDLNLHIWPFSGPLHELLLPGNIVAVETYPAEYYHHLGLSFFTPVRRSKRRQADRLAFGGQLINWARSHYLQLNDSVVEKIHCGFGNQPDGEDQFDALVGLYGMINVIQGMCSFGEPRSTVISNIEGWIFGQEGPKQDY